MTYFYLAILSYGITFLGGVLLIAVEGNHDRSDYIVYGVANSFVFGTALFVALILFVTL